MDRMKESQDYKDFLANGGGMSSYLLDENALRSRLERFYSRKGINGNAVLNSPRKALYWIENLTEAFEVATRIGEYKRAIAEGHHPKHAAYLAREISTDFARRGDSEMLQWALDSVMFLNAAMQGMDRAARGLSTDPNAGQIWRRSAMVAMTSAILYAINRGNPCYERLEDWDKDGHWHIYVPRYLLPWVTADEAGTETDQAGCRKQYVHLRLPKIWEIGAMASLSERTLGEVVDNHWGPVSEADKIEWWKSFGRIMSDQMKLDYVPYVAEPLYALWVNENRFTERPILNLKDQSRMPYKQQNDYTSAIAKRLGEMSGQLDPQNKSGMQLSPKVIDHLIRGYLGTFGLYGQMVGNAIDSNKPALSLDRYPVIRRFYSEAPRSKYETKFWEMARTIEKLYNTANDEALQDRPKQAVAVSGKTGEKEYTAFNKAKREIRERFTLPLAEAYLDKTLSKTEKRDKMQEIRDARAKYMEGFVRDVLEYRKKAKEAEAK